jgi:hypothetical protein
VRIQNTSWPAVRSSCTPFPGKFSFARKRMH